MNFWSTLKQIQGELMKDLILNSKCLVSLLDENVIEATLSLNLISISKENKLEGQYAQSKGGGGRLLQIQIQTLQVM